MAMNELRQEIPQENESFGSVNPVLVKRQYILQQNPFLIGDELDDPALEIKSVDEFTLSRKNDRIPLYLLLSLNDVKRGKKRRLIKRNFKLWKKEYLAKEKEFLQRVHNQKTATKDKNVKKFPFVTWLIYLFSFLMVLVLFYNYPMFQKNAPGVYRFLYRVKEITSTYFGEALLISLSLVLFFVLVYGIYQNRVLCFLNRKFKASSRQLAILSESSKRTFRKKYKKAYRFYLAKIDNPSQNAFGLNNLIEPKYRFSQMEKLFDLDMENASNFAKNNKLFKLKRILMHSVTILLALALICYVGFRMIAK